MVFVQNFVHDLAAAPLHLVVGQIQRDEGVIIFKRPQDIVYSPEESLLMGQLIALKVQHLETFILSKSPSKAISC